METKTIKVARDTNPMEILKLLGDKTKESWIYIHDSVIQALKDAAIKVTVGPESKSYLQDQIVMTTQGPVDIILKDGSIRYKHHFGEWHMVMTINYPGIAFNGAWEVVRTPKNIFMLEQE